MANTTSYELRHENFGGGFETWAVYQVTRSEETGDSASIHVRDADTEEAALDIIDTLTGFRL